MTLDTTKKIEKKEALKKAQDAADAGDNIGMIQWLFNSTLLEGYVNHFSKEYPGLASDDIYQIIANVIDQVSAKVRKGEKIRSIGGYISKVVDCRLIDYVNIKSRYANYNVEDIGTRSLGSEVENDAILEKEERRQKELFTTVERLIPRLNLGNVQEVMKYIFGAVKNGADDISNQEIADALGLPLNSISQYKKRGFERLCRIAKEDNLIDQSYTFSFFQETEYFMEGDSGEANDNYENE